MEAKVSKPYVQLYLALLSSLLLAIAGVNILVDPYKMFRVLTVKGFNHNKYFLDATGLRRVKAFDLAQGDYDTVILGTSRALTGLDPQAPAFGSRKVYNAGLTASNFYEVEKVYRYARNQLKLRTVVIGLDFFTFTGKKSVNRDFDQSLFAGVMFQNPSSYLTDLLSLDTLQLSFKTVARNMRGKAPTYWDNGFRNMNTSHLDQYKLFNTLTKTFFDDDSYGAFSYSQERLELFRQLVEDCKKNNIELHILINPSHAREMEVIRILGLFPQFEQWKRDLVSILDKSNTAHTNTPAFTLWDFSGYNQATTEAIPPKNSPVRMKWYWEASHYRKELGYIVLDKVFGRASNVPAPLTDFGTTLTPNNLEPHLAKIRSQQKQYMLAFPQEVREVEQIARKSHPHISSSQQ